MLGWRSRSRQGERVRRGKKKKPNMLHQEREGLEQSLPELEAVQEAKCFVKILPNLPTANVARRGCSPKRSQKENADYQTVWRTS